MRTSETILLHLFRYVYIDISILYYILFPKILIRINMEINICILNKKFLNGNGIKISNLAIARLHSELT